MTKQMVPLLGEAEPLSFSAKEAGAMWANSMSMPQEARLQSLADARIRRSEDGAWVIRMHPSSDQDASVKRDIALRGYYRLVNLGLNVLNFASTPSISNSKLFTISPWIDGIQPCKEQEYIEVLKILRTYEDDARAQRMSGELVLNPWELMDEEQHSQIGSNGFVFLHDVDPSLI